MTMATNMKFVKFLSPRNMQFLDVLLEVATKEDSPAFSVVWARFAAYFPQHPDAPSQALGKLRELHQLVKEYQAENK